MLVSILESLEEMGGIYGDKHRQTILSSIQLQPASSNVSNTRTAFTVWYFPFPHYYDGLPPPRVSSSTRSNVCRVYSSVRHEEKAVQEGRGKHRAPLSIASNLRRNASLSVPTETLPPRRCSHSPHHLPSLPECRACG